MPCAPLGPSFDPRALVDEADRTIALEAEWHRSVGIGRGGRLRRGGNNAAGGGCRRWCDGGIGLRLRKHGEWLLESREKLTARRLLLRLYGRRRCRRSGGGDRGGRRCGDGRRRGGRGGRGEPGRRGGGGRGGRFDRRAGRGCGLAVGHEGHRPGGGLGGPGRWRHRQRRFLGMGGVSRRSGGRRLHDWLGRRLEGGLGSLLDEVRLLPDRSGGCHCARRPRGCGLLGGAARRSHERRGRRRAVEAGEEPVLAIDDAGGRHLSDPESPCSRGIDIDVDPHRLEACREQRDSFCGRKHVARERGTRVARPRQKHHERWPVADERRLSRGREIGMPGNDGIRHERGGRRRVGPCQRGSARSQRGTECHAPQTGKPEAA